MKWTDAIYDRTETDIDNRTPKAFFNVADWIRINGNTEIIHALVNVFVGVEIDMNEIEEPTVTHFPSASEINQFIENIENLRQTSSFSVSSGIVELNHNYLSGASAIAPDYEDVNDWERDLALLRDYLLYHANYSLYCGTFNCGQMRYWQNGFRYSPDVVKEEYDPKRYPRTGNTCGAGILRQNKWRSPYDGRFRRLRCGVGVCGVGLTRNNNFRRYSVV